MNPIPATPEGDKTPTHDTIPVEIRQHFVRESLKLADKSREFVYDTKWPQVLADEVRSLERRISALEGENRKLRGVAESVCIAEKSRRATVEERRWLTTLSVDARNALVPTPPPQ